MQSETPFVSAGLRLGNSCFGFTFLDPIKYRNTSIKDIELELCQKSFIA